MRLASWCFAVACAIGIGVAAIDAGAAAGRSREQQPRFQIILSGPVSATGVMSDRTVRVSLTPATEAYETGEPWVSVPARAITPDAPAPTASRFRMRAWMDGNRARVMLFAVRTSTESDKETEERFATLLLARGETKIITATDTYGAAPIMLEAAP